VRQRAQLGMAMFLLAETVFFFLLILAFLYFHGSNKDLHLQITAIYSVLLVVSVFSLWRAAASRSRKWLAVTIGLGAAFVVGQAGEYLRLIQDGVTMRQSLFGTTFFTLAGMHELHVLAGLIALAVVPFSALRVIALYWTFFVFVWLVIFIVAYI